MEENGAGFYKSTRPVFHLCFEAEEISLPSPILNLPLSVSVSQVTPAVWWHTACPSSSSTRTLWMWVDPPLPPSDLLRSRLSTLCTVLGLFVCVCVYTGGRGLCGGVLSRLLWELGCGPQPDWWVGLFVCSQVQVIKVSGVPLEKGMKRDKHWTITSFPLSFFPSLSFRLFHNIRVQYLAFMYICVRSLCVPFPV